MGSSDDKGSALRTMREKARLSQWQVARSVGRTQGWLSNIELGYVTPTEEDVLNIAGAIKSLGKKASQACGNESEFLNGGVCEVSV